MSPLTPARAVVRASLAGTCIVAAACGLIGGLIGGLSTAATVATVTAVGAATGAFLTRHRIVAKFSAAQQAAEARGFTDGLSHGLLIGVAQYEAAVFPNLPDGVTAEERDARRTFAYRVASQDGLPERIRRCAARALAALDDEDRHGAHEAMRELFAAVRDQLDTPGR